MHPLTIRSNVYDDEVVIDGVSYGSTPLEVMLPGGEHQIEILKYGYSAYAEKILLKDATAIRAELEKSDYSFTRGEKIQDILYRDVRGPELVVVPAGKFKMGDLVGNGLPNERPAETREIPTALGISDTEITVEQFGNFVEDTAYVTEAEKNGTCASLSNGRPQFNEKLSWKNPGFKQSESSPVVCVSYNDAQAYAEWLTQKVVLNTAFPLKRNGNTLHAPGRKPISGGEMMLVMAKQTVVTVGTDWSNTRPAPVASFHRNPWGLYDTVGNVWEWAETDEGVVVKGGAWNFTPSLARVSTRMELPSDFNSNYIGFRVVRAQ